LPNYMSVHATVVLTMAVALVEISPHIVMCASYPVFCEWWSLRRMIAVVHSLLNEEMTTTTTTTI